jgi:hypothetical protein
MCRPSNYKTRLCRNWQEHGECSFGDCCNFAHGSEEVRGDEEDEAAGGDGQQGRYDLHRSMPCGPGGTLRAQCAVCHCASTL